VLPFRELAIATHLVGVMLWIGGATAAAMVAAASSQSGDRAAIGAARRAFSWIATPGMLLAFLAGLSYLIPNFRALYAHAGWMHIKLTIVLVMAALSGVLSGRLRKTANGQKPASAGFFGGMALAFVVLGASVVFLAMLRPGA
jgi:putative membrane protein